ncbi:MAG: nitrogenase component 1 [Desulfovibrio sp.]|nr:nitrogenase component 1 [Desulfovibrio sp.]
MKGLLKRLTPFATDQSGAVSALYEMGGLIVICDAGGCTGNICGFDEPRWEHTRSAIFSAGLRDMDAILGRDELLVKKTVAVARELGVPFAAVVGTPVPAVIGTDIRALARMGEKRLGIPFLPVTTTGTGLYDAGAGMALKTLFERFCPVGDSSAAEEKEEGSVGVLGATPLDLGRSEGGHLAAAFLRRGWKKAVCYGMGAGLGAVEKAGRVARNVVIAPSGMESARYLLSAFGIPYSVAWPMVPRRIVESCAGARRVLVIHQHVCACAVRRALEGAPSPQGERQIAVGSFFERVPDLIRTGDFAFCDEDDLAKVLNGGHWDCIVADAFLGRVMDGGAAGRVRWVDLPHFAVSGRLVEDGDCADGIDPGDLLTDAPCGGRSCER